MSTRAVRDGDGWRVSGQKVWTSGAQFADVGELLCRTGDEPQHRNLSAFLVEVHAPGFGGAGLLDVERYKAMLRHFGLADDPLMRQRLAQLYVETRVAKYSRLRAAAAARAAGHAPGPEASLGKLSLSRNTDRIASFVSDALGTRLVADTGGWGTHARSRFLLGTPGHRLGGGTDEILRTTVGERVLGLPKEPKATDE